MFLEHSRYAKVATVDTTTASGEKTVALKLRKLTPATGEPYVAQTGDRLDLIADAKYADATQFWHVADANTALDGRTLVEDVGATIAVPKA
jgi:hypothetical protein